MSILEIGDCQKEEDVWDVTPDPGFCVKFKDSQNGFGKVFFNFCLCDQLPPPAKDLDEEGLASVVESNNAESYKIPLSVGEIHMEADKSGSTCAVIEIIINRQFFHNRVSSSDLFQAFLVLVGVDAVEAKHKIKLNKQEWIILKNRKNVGQLMAQKIRKKQSRPLIEEVSETEASNATEIPKPKEPPIKMIIREAGSVPTLELTAHLHGVEKLEEIELEMNEDRVKLRVGEKYFIDFHLPVLIDSNSIETTFGEKSALLKVTAKCLDS